MDSIGGQPSIALFTNRTTNPALPSTAAHGADITGLRAGKAASGPTHAQLLLEHASGAAATYPGPVVVWAWNGTLWVNIAQLNDGLDIVVESGRAWAELLMHLPTFSRLELRGGSDPTGGGLTGKLSNIVVTE